jgi:hypothetical protein
MAEYSIEIYGPLELSATREVCCLINDGSHRLTIIESIEATTVRAEAKLIYDDSNDA